MDRLSDYDYELPEALIAQVPLADRSASRLLVLHRKTGQVEHKSFRDVPGLLRPGDLLVMNDTRVTARRLNGRKPTGGAVEALLLRPLGEGRFEALVKPGRRVGIGAEIEFGSGLAATVEDVLDDGLRVLRFAPMSELESHIAASGETPLPPYIHTRLKDDERYQTVYASHAGSAAAPTAGLHFTSEILESLRSMGVETATVTLDVGIDTFRPVAEEDLDLHRMHGESCCLPQETAIKINQCTGRIIAVGTTTVRTLETMALGPHKVAARREVSKLFIRPGYEFRIIDGMFTNFHLPKTTMLMMLAALAGRDRLLDAYSEAVQQNYRFLSFGDSMLLV